MIYKFKSQADGDVIMLEPNGAQTLNIIGREPTAQGIVTVAQMWAAIAALEAAVITHESADTRVVDHGSSMELDASGNSVRLRERAGPLIDLLRSSAMAGKDMVWGMCIS